MSSSEIIVPISADSHITEPPDCYSARIDKAWADKAPHIVNDPKMGEVFRIPGLDRPIPMGLIAAAGRDPKDLKYKTHNYRDLHPGGYDATKRLADQDRDGVFGEIIYPSVGMLLCNHPDFDFKRACFNAYNLWLEEYCDHAPGRLFGMAQIAMRTVEEGIADLQDLKARGFRGVMMPGEPALSDYHDPIYDPFYEAAVALKMPLSFHILTSSGAGIAPTRGPKINGFQSIIRGNQDILGTFIFGGVFDRHPDLKIVCVEADAGWAPHWMYRADHAYNHHRYWMKCDELQRMPSDYFKENIYLTFQDDWSAFKAKDELNVERLMWANDFPHSDATWPRSQEILAQQTQDLTMHEKQRILRDNVRDLYDLPIPDAPHMKEAAHA
ncbi:amidohydrolase family protein [Minwuia sp.]|uniref:amidohydrolase family protein n=1 Tax=Minwuia sp. TaxID=2493630 RepID=UPI003A8FD8CA